MHLSAPRKKQLLVIWDCIRAGTFHMLHATNDEVVRHRHYHANTFRSFMTNELQYKRSAGAANPCQMR